MLLTISQKVDSTIQFFTVLLIFILVLGITAFTTKWMAGYQKQHNQNGNLEVIEAQRIAPGKYLQIVRVGEKYLAIAVSKDTVTMLAEIPKEQLVFRDEVQGSVGSFHDLFEKIKNNNFDKKQEPKEK